MSLRPTARPRLSRSIVHGHQREKIRTERGAKIIKENERPSTTASPAKTAS